jgi:hypothetical protein
VAGRYTVSRESARTVDGIVFHSKAESRRYRELKLLEKVGSVTDLELQPEFELLPSFTYHGKKERGVKYRADFRYRLHGKEIVEDVKGHRTEVYKIKRKMLLHRYPEINFREVT